MTTSRVPPTAPARAVLFDRDGTLVDDVPYNGDPARVRLLPGARQAVGRLREAGLRVGLVTNQSGVGRGLLTVSEVESVHRELERHLGVFDAICCCFHAPDAGCGCRKPRPGLVLAAAARLRVAPWACVVIGDRESDVEAARAAGAAALLVRAGPAADLGGSVQVGSLAAAVDLVLDRRDPLTPTRPPGADGATGERVVLPHGRTEATPPGSGRRRGPQRA